MAGSSNTCDYTLVAVLPGRLRVSLRSTQQQLLEEAWQFISSVREPCEFAVSNFRVSDDELSGFIGLLRHVIKTFSRSYNGLYCNFRGLITHDRRLGARLAGGSQDIAILNEHLRSHLERFMGPVDATVLPHVVLFGHIPEDLALVAANFNDHFMGGGVFHQFELRRRSSCINDKGVVSVYTI